MFRTIALFAVLACFATSPTPSRADGPIQLAAHSAADVTPSPSVAEMLEEIRFRVQQAAVYPPRARELGLEGVTRIQFQIDARGNAMRISTVESSGSSMLDAAAEQGARDAAPLPSLAVRIRIPIRFGLQTD